MAKNVFILGAGASAHAGTPLMKDFYGRAVELIENNNLDKEDERYFKTIKDTYLNNIRLISQNFNFKNLKNIETIFSLIEMARITNKFSTLNKNQIQGLNVAINKFIVRTIEKTTDLQFNSKGKLISPKHYESFYLYLLEEMHEKNPDNCCVISFNYDLALDYIIEKYGSVYGINYFINNIAKNSLGYKLIKLHGSLNWGKCSKCEKINAFSILDNNKLTIHNKHVEMSKKLPKLHCKWCRGEISDLPLIVPPTWNKTGNYGIENVWQTAVKELSRAKNIFIIGYSLPESDLFFRYMLALGTLDIPNLNRFWIFDTDANIKEKYSKFFQKDMLNKYKFFESTFAGAIGTIRTELKDSSPEFFSGKKAPTFVTLL